MPTSTAARRRVLVVDDDPSCGNAVARIIGLRHEATWLPSARAALARIEDGAAFDLVVSDVQMPGMSGPELLAQLSARAHPLAARFVLMTGDPAARDCDGLADRPLEKPVSATRLLAAIEERLGR